jgi:mannose-1-phosphate guanylyltransferase/mannose-6-phosphate isomerase
VVIGMQDAVLVARKDHAQDVKIAVQILKEKNVEQGEVLPRDYRPWGWFETLVDEGFFKVKYILVYAGGCLSLQSHQHRSEHWVMVDGDAKVTLNNTVTIVKKGESVYIPVGSRHRIENPGDSPLIFIEVQLGSYLGEDDIIRYEDVYQRS